MVLPVSINSNRKYHVNKHIYFQAYKLAYLKEITVIFPVLGHNLWTCSH